MSSALLALAGRRLAMKHRPADTTCITHFDAPILDRHHGAPLTRLDAVTTDPHAPALSLRSVMGTQHSRRPAMVNAETVTPRLLVSMVFALVLAIAGDVSADATHSGTIFINILVSP